MIYDIKGFTMEKSNEEILAELDALVYGHTEAKKTLINLVRRSKLRYKQKWHWDYTDEGLVPIINCLLIGASGTGKTHLVESLRKIMNFPFMKFDATTLQPTSAVGGVTSEGFRKRILDYANSLFEDRKHEYHSVDGICDQMIVFVDEIDKLGLDGGSGWNKNTQSNFLSLFENKGKLSAVSYIFAGAFSGMKCLEKGGGKKSIGFAEHVHVQVSEHHEFDSEIIKFGLMPELVGRVGSIIPLDVLTEDDYRNILLEVMLPKAQDTLYHLGVHEFDLANSEIDELVSKAHSSEQGVRFLTKGLAKLSRDAEFYGFQPKPILRLTRGHNE